MWKRSSGEDFPLKFVSKNICEFVKSEWNNDHIFSKSTDILHLSNNECYCGSISNNTHLLSISYLEFLNHHHCIYGYANYSTGLNMSITDIR